MPGGSWIHGREALDELLEVFHLFFAALPLVLLLLRQDPVDTKPEIVVAGVHPYLAEIYVTCVGAYGVQEMAIMRDHDHDVGKLDQELLKPGD